MGFYAACTKAVWLFRLAQRQQQTVAVSDNQAAAGLTEREKVPQHRWQIILLPYHLTNKQPYCTAAPHIQTERHTDIFPAPTSQRDTPLTCTTLDYMVGKVRICSLFIKYNIQQQAEATQEQHLSTWTLTEWDETAIRNLILCDAVEANE